MKRAVRRVTRLGYKRLAKPVLFRQHPDGVHHRLIRAAKVVQKLPLSRTLPRLWVHTSPALKQEVWGLAVANPVGLSAGFDKNIDIATVIRNVGFGFMIGGSVTAEPCDGNPKPWFYRLPHTKSLVVHAGLPNQGVRRIARRLETYPRQVFENFPLGVSVAKTNSKASVSEWAAIEDYCASLSLLNARKLGQFFEINISCPNTFGGEPFTTPEKLDRLLTEIDLLKLTRPVVVKMPLNLKDSDFDALLAVIVRHEVRGVTIANLLRDREGVDSRDALPASIKGNLSGAPTRAKSTALIARTYRQYGDRLTIIGVGGIFSAEDAYEKIRAGATLVALITGMIFEGPQLVGEINHGLEQLLKRDGYKTIADAVGIEAQKGVY